MAAQIGLTAVMEMAGFTSGINKYNQMMGGASSNTEKHAGIMSRALAGIGTVMKTAGAIAAGGIAAVVSAVTGATLATVSWAEKLDSVSDVLGTTTEESAALAVAAQHIGGNVEQLSSQLAIMTRGLFDAKGEIGPTGLVLQKLGVTFQDANGKILPTTDILQAVADKLGVMPDGLEKTQLMMDVFGKSGKDMSDMLGVLAEGGMAKFDQKAKDLGLSMSEDAVNGAIELNRAFKDLKMQGQGLLVSLGTKLLPIIQPLVKSFGELVSKGVEWLNEKITEAMPTIQKLILWFQTNIPVALAKVSDVWNTTLQPVFVAIGNYITGIVIPAVGNLVTWFKDNLPAAITTLTDFWNNKLLPAIKDFADWVAANWQPLAAGIAAALLIVVVPAVIAWIASTWAAVAANAALAIATLAAYAPIIAIMAVVAAAVFLLYKAWTENFLGIRTVLTDFWNNTLKPVFADIVNWFEVAIPKAIVIVKGFWENTLLPAIKAVWQFISETLIPIFEKIVTWLGETIGKAITIAAGFWEKILRPAIYTVWEFLYNKVFPIFRDVAIWLGETIGNVIKIASFFWTNTLLPAITDIWKFINEKLLPVFASVLKWFKDDIAGPIANIAGVFEAAAKGGFQFFLGVIRTIIDALQTIIDKVKEAIEWLNSLGGEASTHAGTGGGGKGKVGTGGGKFGEEKPFGEGIIGGIQGITGGIVDGFRGLTGGLTGLVAAIAAISDKLKDINITDPLTSFAGAILGRFQSKVTGPLEGKLSGLRERLRELDAYMLTPEANADIGEVLRLQSERAAIEAELAATSEELNIQKERELELQKQLNDLAFLQAQMDFLSFLRENELNIGDILGDLQLGLDLDLPAFMDAVARAIAALVANLGGEVAGGGAGAGGAGGGTTFGGGAKPLGGGMQVYNNQAVNIYFSATLNNGMDFETFKIGVLDVVKGAIA